ncbi:MAG: glycoside hydrolase family 3 C-terminal domain-containing protein [Bacteroidaceae bacterium]|nr:glycoside hydrolase family 3 C-terminal domain-containing protein [Bacteroidaceae bacterium]MBQ9883480.1 glycoside hydrolase family 3 C-terminal domain-containing protein [Bacteroidaceae bacterium]
MNSRILLAAAVAGSALLSLSSCNGQKWTEESKGSYNLVTQPGGQALGYSPESGVKLLTDGGYAFKDLNRNGTLDPYEDWRLDPKTRATDLAKQLSIEEIAGLMLYSAHQSIPAASMGGRGAAPTYNGKPFEESGAKASDLSDAQKKFLSEDNLRAVLVTRVQSPEVAAEWNNNVQAFVEGLNHGIPANNSSDPRHTATSDAEYNYGAGGQISMWPSSLGMAATFDPALMKQFGQIASQEYRALGIATALSPQVDLATDPRWSRFSGTFGEGTKLATDLARAYCDGFQTSPAELAIDGAWGYQSVNAMVKHWYGYGAQEGGRDSHYNYGKFAVYPGENREEHKLTFTEGAFKLQDGTQMASAVMPIYSILFNQDPSGENVGGSFSKWMIEEQLRNDNNFDGVVCTDWGITNDNKAVEAFDGKPWGVETMSIAQRHYQILKAGVDQFGGNNDKGPVLEAYQMWVNDFGKESADARFQKSAYRLLLNVFRTGLFENPYLDPQETAAIVGKSEFMEAGYNAQLKSVVMLKNHNKALPQAEKKKVYIPKRHETRSQGFFGATGEDRWVDPVNLELVKKYFEVVETPAEADFAIAFIQAPNSGAGYSADDAKRGGNGYIPISLQYNDYTATYARATSIAGGDPLENFSNRTYKGKSVKTSNKDDLKMVVDTKAKMGQKPVIVVLNTGKPVVPAEFESKADAILISFGIQNQAIFDIISGKAEPSGLLPMQMPADMKTVEQQNEDVPRDMVCYKDADGNLYDFGFGLNWSGVINDARVQAYK